jgi:predicted RNA-binding Zn-ribbon protein involved in translation (DUF1610 family)
MVSFATSLAKESLKLKMPSKQKINRKKVEAALNTLCPKCGYSIPPAEIRRYDFNTMKCPKCGEHFTVEAQRKQH